MKTNKNGVKLLVAIMVFAMAFAGVVVMTDDSDAITKAPTGTEEIETGDSFTDALSGSYQLTEDITINNAVSISEDVVIYGNGHTITLNKLLTFLGNAEIYDVKFVVTDGDPDKTNDAEGNDEQDTVVISGSQTVKDKTILLDGCTIDGADEAQFGLDVFGKAILKNTDIKNKKLIFRTQATGVELDGAKNVYLNLAMIPELVIVGDGQDIPSDKKYVKIGNNSTISTMSMRGNVNVNLNENTLTIGTILSKTDAKPTISNGTVIGDFDIYENEVEGNDSAAIAFDGVTIKGDNKVGDGIKFTVAKDKELTIDGVLSGNVDIESGGTVVNNNTAPGANLIPTSGNASGEGWSLVGTTLTLNGYDGSNIFKGSFTEVILIGDNRIVLDADENPLVAIESSELKTIKTQTTGTGSLSIVISGDNAGAAIIASKELEINGVSIDIEINNTTEDKKSNFGAIVTLGESNKIAAFTTLGILFADVTIVIGDADNAAIGIDATTLTVTRSTLDVDTPGKAINAPTSNIAESTIIAESETDAFTSANAGISNESTITVKSVKGYGFVGAFNISQGSTFTASSMEIKGKTTSYANIVNDGNMVIDTNAEFTNNATFTNNGTVGVYGTFINADGETTNNGEINTYGYVAGTYDNNVVITNGKDNITLKFTEVTAQADGTFKLAVTVVGTTDADNITIDGTMTYTGSKMVIKAVDNDYNINISITFDDKGEVKAYSASIMPVLSESAKKVEQGDVIAAALKPLKGLVSTSETDKQTISVSGGKFTNNGSVEVNTEMKKFVAGGEFVNSGTVEVNNNITMISGKLNGNAIDLGKKVTVTITKGTVDISFTYEGEYTYEDDDTEKDVTVQFVNELKIVGDCENVAFSTVEGTAADTPAVFSMTSNSAAEDKTIKVTIVKGTAFAVAGTFAKDVTVEVLSGATFQATVDITIGDGVLAAQDGAILNIRGDTDESFKYNKLDYDISFAKDGYTYYGNLAYALANASEGMKLTLNSKTGEITEDLVVGKGITLEFAKGAVLTIGNATTKKITVSMLEGASFVMTDSNNIEFTGKGATVSGTFTYDGNTVVLNNVFMDNADTIGCQKATKTEVSAITISIATDLVDGTVTASAGKTVIGANFSAVEKKTTSKLVVSEEATATGTIGLLTGASANIDGTLYVANKIDVYSALAGNGAIVLKDNASAIFYRTVAQNITVANEGTDKVVLKDMVVNNKDAEQETNYTVTVKSVAKSGNKDACLDVAGEYFSGEIEIVGNGSITALTVDKKAVLDIPAGSIITVLGDSYANGLVKVAGTINMKIDGDSSTVSYSELKYEITYTDGEYTVYTVVATAVENAKAGDSFTLTDDLNVEGKLEIPSGVTIIVPEDYKIILGAGEHLVIGSPITTIGATGGIDGTVELDVKAYIISFEDPSMDISKMKIVSSDSSKKIVDSQVTVLNKVYATLFAVQDNEIMFGDSNDSESVASKIVPEIEGYRFVKFTDAVDKAVDEKYIGSTDVVANMLPGQIQVVFEKVDGIAYYVNNERQFTVGAPVYVAYGSTVTAVADSGYTGTALVNGQSYIIVDSTTTTITGSGVVAGSSTGSSDNGGMSITDILLIVLVVLIVIMAVLVALRMMRS